MERWRCKHFARPLLAFGVTGLVACSRSEVPVVPGEGGGSSHPATTSTSSIDLPPPPPVCPQVRFDSCHGWPEPLVVSLPSEAGHRPDVAWQGQVHLVAYSDFELDRSLVAAVTPQREVLFREPVGQLYVPRIAYNPKLGVGMAVGERGVQWLGNAGAPNGAFAQTGPFGGTTMNADVGATEAGFTVIVSPTSAPGGPPPAHFASLGPSPGVVQWSVFYDHSPNPSIEHCAGVDGLVHRFGFEGFGEDGNMELVAFELAGGTPVGPVGAPYDLGSGTTFTDGMACDGPRSFFLSASQQMLGIVAMHVDGSSEGYGMLSVADAGRPHLERLGTATALAEIVIASPGLVGGDTMAVASWAPELGLGTPLVVGQGGDDPRMARTRRGLALAWTREGAVLLQELDCCVAR